VKDAPRYRLLRSSHRADKESMTTRRLAVCGLILGVALLGALPAAAQTIDPEFKADIERLLDVSGASAMGVQMANLATASVINGLKQMQPGVPERAFTIVQEVLGEEFSRAFTAPDGIRAKLVALYATHFTHAEVRGLLSFYQTDLGRKTIEVLPKLAQGGAAIGEEWAAANMPRVLTVLQARLKAEGIFP
jgi:hypothetical protein